MINIKSKKFLVFSLVFVGIVFFGYDNLKAYTNDSGWSGTYTCDKDGTSGDCYSSRTLPNNDEYQAYYGRWQGNYDGTGSGGHIRVTGCLSNSPVFMGSGDDVCWELVDWLRGNSDGSMGPYFNSLSSSGGFASSNDFNYWNVNVWLNDAVVTSQIRVEGRKAAIESLTVPGSTNVGNTFTVSWDISDHGGLSPYINDGSLVSCGSPSSPDGSVTCTALAAGTANIELEARGYGGYGVVASAFDDRNITISGTSSIIVRCVITDGSTGLRVSSALCNIASQSGNTDSNGLWATPSSVASGTYTLTVSKSNYGTYTGSYGISGSTDLPVTIWPTSSGSVSCTIADPNVDTGETAYFTAGGGSGTYSWSAPGGSPSTGGNSSGFSTTYSTTGTKTVTVTRGSTSDTCTVTVSSGGGGGSCVHNAFLEFVNPIPSTLAPGQVLNFQVRVNNIGNTRWAHGDGWRMEYVGSTLAQSYLATADLDGVMPYTQTGAYYPTESNILSFTLTAPPTPGAYQFGFQMRYRGSPYQNSLSYNPACPQYGPDIYFGTNLIGYFNVASAPTASAGCNVSPAGPSNNSCNTPYNNNIYLFWDSTNATSCSVVNTTSGSTILSGGPAQAPPGSPGVNVGNLIANTTFRVDCSGIAGTASSNLVTVTVDNPAPTVDTITISSPTVTANGTSIYTITMTSYDSTGGGNITHNYSLINHQGTYPGQYRGFLTWYYDSAYTGWDVQKDKRVCTGNTGIGAILQIAPNDIYGHTYLRLDSCSSSVSGTTRTTNFVVRFEPIFVTNGPLTNNGISGWVYNATTALADGWEDHPNLFNISFTDNSAFVSQSGIPGTMTAGQTYPISVTMQNTGESTWNTASSYALGSYNPYDNNTWGTGRTYLTSATVNPVPPGGTTTFNFNITAPSTPGLYYFQRQMVHDLANGSLPPAWFGATTPNTGISVMAGPVNGACGTANRSYPFGVTSYGSDTYCSAGNPSSSPAFPATGTSVNWTCLGTNGGFDSPQCTATAQLETFTLTVNANPGPGGTIRSSDNNINCGTTCSAIYSQGSVVTLTATPASFFWRFTGWSGGGCTGTGNCTITVNANTVINATFDPRPFNLIEF